MALLLGRGRGVPAMNPSPLKLSLLVAVGAFLALPGAARGADCCVGAPPGCGGVSAGGDLQAALDAALTAPGPDRVLVGPGTYSRNNGFSYVEPEAANTVEV